MGLEGIGAQHPFLPRTAMVLTAEFVTMDSGTNGLEAALLLPAAS